MTRAELEQSIIALLRKQALSGSTREISLTEPLGEQGLGLDSLGLISFLIVLEKTYQVRMPEDLWTEKPLVTVSSLVDLVESAPAGEAARSDASHSGPGAAVSSDTRLALLRDDRSPRRLSRELQRRAARLVRPVCSFRRMVFLERRLDSGPLPAFTASLDLTLRETPLEEAAGIAVLWGPKAANRDRWIRAGNICLTAWHQGSLVGIDWIAPNREEEGITGLLLRMTPGTCFGLGLYEDPAVEGKGVGLALLAHSLAESRRRGFARQVTLVDGENVRMLTASLQLMGFRVIGEARTIAVFGRPWTRWRVNGVSSRDRVVDL